MIGPLSAALLLAWGAVAPAQRLARAVDHAEHARRLAAFVDRRRDVAIEDRDAALLGCLDDKAVRLRALTRTAEEAVAALRRVPPPGEEDAEAELLKALLARRRAQAVRAEAERCLGKLAWQTEARTRVTVTRPGDKPRAEPAR